MEISEKLKIEVIAVGVCGGYSDLWTVIVRCPSLYDERIFEIIQIFLSRISSFPCQRMNW